MPRPKRTKVAPSVPAPRRRRASKPVAEVAQLPEGPKLPVDDLYGISDPDQATSGTGSARKNRRRGNVITTPKAQIQRRVRESRIGGGTMDGTDIAVEMSGALAAAQSEESLLSEIDLESSSPSMEVGRRDTSANVAESSVLALGNFRRRPRQPSVLGRGALRARSSSIDSQLAEDNGLVSVGKKNKLKRNQREQSRTGRNTVRSSSMGLDMNRATPAVGSVLRLGNFKRRAREPSLLRTAQKERPQPTNFDLEDDDEDDFSPDDESTPLNISKSKPTVMSSAGSSNSRKRKLSVVQVPQSQTPHSSPPPRPVEAPIEELEQEDTVPATGPLASDDDEEQNDESEQGIRSPSQELPLLSIEARPSTPEPFSETNAPPQSSSSAPESPPPPRTSHRQQAQDAQTRGRRMLRGRAPLQSNLDSPPSSPPSLTHSPNRPATRSIPRSRARKETPPVSTLPTAALQAFLPRRRRHATRDPFDIVSEDEIDVSGLASDDDELTHTTVRAPPRRNNPQQSSHIRKPTKLKPAINKGKGSKITYGRNATSDKENEEAHDPDDSLGPLPDDVDPGERPENSQELEERVGKELKRAAKKFQEVDKWEMEFEECTASSSSQHDAR